MNKKEAERLAESLAHVEAVLKLLERDHIDLNWGDSGEGPNLIQAVGRMEAGRYDKALFLGSS